MVRLPSSELKISGDEHSSGPSGGFFCLFVYLCKFVSFMRCYESVLVEE